ncbi:hypothetical protein IQ07DRAFT_506101 [Pyrenochaeta sp. DS3sAY3a]|nr:hypothetical protein IQ07DRAFT_506101 [Pyrenochaeta sp. DS3sAY3a]
MSNQCFDDLPDELVHLVARHLRSSKRNDALLCFALVNRRTSIFAKEVLLKEPRFNICYLGSYLHELFRAPQIRRQVVELEMYDTRAYGELLKYSSHDLYPRHRWGDPGTLNNNPKFAAFVREVVDKFALTEGHKAEWLHALDNDVLPACLGVLVCVLPKLKVLDLLETYLVTQPMFSNILATDVVRAGYSPEAWRQPYLAGAMKVLQQRLQVLLMPSEMVSVDWDAMFHHSAFDYQGFQRLTELSIPMESLENCTDGSDYLPKSLEVLRVVEANHDIICYIVDVWASKTNGTLPNLRRLELYFRVSEREEIREQMLQEPSEAREIWEMSRLCGLEVHMAFS